MTTCCQRPHRCGGGGRNATSSGRTDAELHACSAVRAQCAARMPRKRAAQCAMRQGNKKQIGHHARPRRASTTVPLRTGADTCKTGSGAGKRSGAKADSVGGATTHGWRTRQASESVPTQTWSGAGECGPPLHCVGCRCGAFPLRGSKIATAPVGYEAALVAAQPVAGRATGWHTGRRRPLRQHLRRPPRQPQATALEGQPWPQPRARGAQCGGGSRRR